MKTFGPTNSVLFVSISIHLVSQPFPFSCSQCSRTTKSSLQNKSAITAISFLPSWTRFEFQALGSFRVLSTHSWMSEISTGISTRECVDSYLENIRDHDMSQLIANRENITCFEVYVSRNVRSLPIISSWITILFRASQPGTWWLFFTYTISLQSVQMSRPKVAYGRD